MTVRFYSSEDTSAPVLSGSTDTLINLLDAILVNGYGSKTAAGWTKPYSATDKAVYRSSVSTGKGFYLRVVDNQFTNKGAYWQVYHTMSDADTGTGVTPPTTSFASGFPFFKSSAANTSAVQWVAMASANALLLIVCKLVGASIATETSANSFEYIFCGDLKETAEYDPYAYLAVGRTNATEASATPYDIATLAAGNNQFYSIGNQTGTFVGGQAVGISPGGVPAVKAVPSPTTGDLSSYSRVQYGTNSLIPPSGYIGLSKLYIYTDGMYDETEGRLRGVAPLITPDIHGRSSTTSYSFTIGTVVYDGANNSPTRPKYILLPFFSSSNITTAFVQFDGDA